MLATKFPYKDYPRNTAENGFREYIINGNALPSVTTILSATKPKESADALQNWRDSIGHEEAERIVNESGDIGSTLHDNLEHHIRSKRKPNGPLLVKMMTDVIIKKGLKNINEYWGLEVPLFVDKVYAGTADLVCVHDGIPTIGDFKNARNNKSIDQIDDYRCQIAAYALAHNAMFDTDIKKGVIMMVTQNCNYLEYIIEGGMFDESVDMWMSRLQEYYNSVV